MPKRQESTCGGGNSDAPPVLESNIDPLNISWENPHIIISPVRERFVIFRGSEYESKRVPRKSCKVPPLQNEKIPQKNGRKCLFPRAERYLANMLESSPCHYFPYDRAIPEKVLHRAPQPTQTAPGDMYHIPPTTDPFWWIQYLSYP